MSDTAKITLRIKKEMLDRIRQRASERNLSINQFTLALYSAALEEEIKPVFRDHETPTEKMYLRLTHAERTRIREEAARQGLTPKQLILQLMDQAGVPPIRIAALDLTQFEAKLDPYFRTIYGIAETIRQTEKAFPADVKKLLETTAEIYKLFLAVYKLESDHRYQLYEECRKKYFARIESTKAIRGSIRRRTDGSHKD